MKRTITILGEDIRVQGKRVHTTSSMRYAWNSLGKNDGDKLVVTTEYVFRGAKLRRLAESRRTMNGRFYYYLLEHNDLVRIVELCSKELRRVFGRIPNSLWVKL